MEETIDPTRDLTGASIAPAGASSLAFGLELAGSVANGARFGYATFNLDNGSRWVGVAPQGNGTWYSYVQAGSTPFPWSAAGFEDITAAGVTEAANGEIDLSMTLAGAVPSSFGPDDAAPTYVWFFDSDGNDSTGGSLGADVNAQVRWNPAGGFEAALRVWMGNQYEDLPSEAGSLTIDGSRITLRTSVAALGLSPSFRWYAAHVTIGPPGDAYQNRVDATAPRAPSGLHRDGARRPRRPQPPRHPGLYRRRDEPLSERRPLPRRSRMAELLRPRRRRPCRLPDRRHRLLLVLRFSTAHRSTGTGGSSTVRCRASSTP